MANTIDINIPGIGNVSVNAPGFATEATLTKLVAIMANKGTAAAKGIGAVGAAAAGAADPIKNLGNAAKSAGEKFEKGGEVLNNEIAALGHQFTEAVSVIGRQVGNMLKLSDGTSSLSNGIDVVIDGLKQATNLLYLLPGIGIAGKAILDVGIDAVLGGLQGVLHWYVQQTDVLRGIQRSMYSSNLQMEGGLNDLDHILVETSLTMQNLTSVAQNAGSSLRMMSGGASKALQRLAKGFNALSDANRQELIAQGYDRSEILAGMAHYAASVEQFGKELSPAELAEGTAAYMKNMRELQRLSGLSIQEQEAQIDKNRASLFVQNQLNGAVSAEARAFTERFITQVDPVIQDFVISGRNTTKESGVVTQSLATYTNGLRDITQQLQSGSIDFDQAMAMQSNLLKDPRVLSEMKNNQELFGQVPGELYGSLSGVISVLGEMQKKIYGDAQAAEGQGFDPSKMSQLDRNVANFVDYTDFMNNALQASTTALMKFATSMPILNVETGIGSVVGLARLFKELVTTSDADRKRAIEDEIKRMEWFKNYQAGEEAKYKLGIETDSIFTEDLNVLGGPGKYDPQTQSDKLFFEQLQDGQDIMTWGPKPFTPDGRIDPNWHNPDLDLVPKGLEVLPELGTDLPGAGLRPMSYKPDSKDPIAVTIADVTVWEDIRKKLDILNATNGQIVREMERSNTIAKQNGYASA